MKRKRRTTADILTDAAHAMITPPKGNDIVFLHSALCQLTLPCRAVHRSSYNHSSGNSAITITRNSCCIVHRDLKDLIPHGSKLRLLLYYLSTFCVCNKTIKIPLGGSIGWLSKQLGLSTQGGERGPLTALKNQLLALRDCQIVLRKENDKFAIISSLDIALSNSGRIILPELVTLTPEFYRSIKKHAVPLDRRAVWALTHSPLAMDIYAWLVSRLQRVYGENETIRWRALKQQFGPQYCYASDFKKAFVQALNTAKAVYPMAQADLVDDGILLKPSPPAVPLKDT